MSATDTSHPRPQDKSGVCSLSTEGRAGIWVEAEHQQRGPDRPRAVLEMVTMSPHKEDKVGRRRQEKMFPRQMAIFTLFQCCP